MRRGSTSTPSERLLEESANGDDDSREPYLSDAEDDEQDLLVRTDSVFANESQESENPSNQSRNRVRLRINIPLSSSSVVAADPLSEDAAAPSLEPPLSFQPSSQWSKDAVIEPVSAFDFPSFCGPNVSKLFTSPSDFWNLFFTDQILERIVLATNCKVHMLKMGPRPVFYSSTLPWPPSYLNDYPQLTVSELKIFIGLTYRMGILPRPSLRLYWSNDPFFYDPYFSTMSRNRFQAILSTLCLSLPPTTVKPNSSKEERIKEKLSKFMPMLGLLTEQFRQHFKLNEHGKTIK